MKEKTKTWFEMAKSDLDFAGSIIRTKKRAYYAVHFCHQAVEKVLKAIVQEHTDEEPKRTHNFKVLCEQARLELPAHVAEFLAKLAPHYLASKYPEDLEKLYKTYTISYAADLYEGTQEMFSWLENYLRSKRS